MRYGTWPRGRKAKGSKVRRTYYLAESICRSAYDRECYYSPEEAWQSARQLIRCAMLPEKTEDKLLEWFRV